MSVPQPLFEKSNNFIKTTSTKPKFNPSSAKEIVTIGSSNPKVLKLLQNFNSPTAILDFGNEEMSKIAAHSEAQLSAVKDADVTYVEQQLTGIIILAKSLDLQQNSNKKLSVSSLISSIKSKFIDVKEQMMSEFTDISTKIDDIIIQVDNANNRIVQKLEGFQDMYKNNLEEYNNLTRLIEVAEEVYKIKSKEIETLRMNSSSDLLSTEEVNRQQSILTRLEKKIVNLKKFQIMAIQTAPEISQMMDEALIIIEKFNDIKQMTIPLWKRSIRKYIDGAELRKAALLEKSVNDANNNLLVQNSNQSKDNAIAIATLNNRDIVDDETLEIINKNLIDSLTEVASINKLGSQKRLNSVNRMEEMKELYSNIALGKVKVEDLKHVNR
jgi:uncharacterized protein YaaN involved in tellurite resistance